MLPQGFTRVEWIESTGEQYIDTGQIINKSDTRKIIMTAQFTSNTSYGGANGYLQFQANIASGNKAEIVIDYNGSTHVTSWYVNGALTSSRDWTSAYSGANIKIGLFYMGDVGNTWYTGTSPQKGKKWDWKLYAGDTLLVDMIMAVSASEVAGMYDDVAGIFRTNAGAGTFLAGPALVPDAPANLTQATEGTTVTLTWSASEYANHYKIIRDGTELADIDGDIFAYIDTTAEAGATHTYKVVACNGVQDGGASTIEVRLALLLPQILAALIEPNPTTINSKITITVRVDELEIIPQPVWFYSGEIYAGEV